MTPETSGGELDVEEILAIVARAKRLDLRDYRRSTLARRIRDRMSSCGARGVADYGSLLERDPAELDRLADSLLVHATSFFRDPHVFEALERVVLPDLARAPSRCVRAWTVGVATGEEAWSTAALLASREGLDWDVVATDRDARSLATAREGCYVHDDRAYVPERYRGVLFERDERETLIALALRERVRFAEHDLLGPRLAPAAAIVAEFDLLLCRNVLIYLDARFQKHATERLAAVLRPGGCLVLGISEGVPEDLADRFETFPGTAPTLRIFRRRPPR